MKNSNTILLAVVGALLIGALSFAAGRQVSGFRNGGRWMSDGDDVRQGGMMGMHGRGFVGPGDGMMGGGNRGEITKVDGNTLTLKLADGTTTTATLSSDTVVYTMTKGAAATLKAGQTVMITGGGFWGNQTVIVRP